MLSAISGSRNTPGLVSTYLKKRKKLVTNLLSIESFRSKVLISCCKFIFFFNCKMLILLEKWQVER